MQKLSLAIAGVFLAAAAPAHAAHDAGLSLHQSMPVSVRAGVGAQATLTVKLDGRTRTADTSPLRLAVSAGPALSRIGQPHIATRVAPLARIGVRPHHAASLSIGGQTVASYDLSPRFAPSSSRPAEGPHTNMSTGAKVAIGVGVIMLIGVGLLYNRLVESSD